MAERCSEIRQELLSKLVSVRSYEDAAKLKPGDLAYMEGSASLWKTEAEIPTEDPEFGVRFTQPARFGFTRTIDGDVELYQVEPRQYRHEFRKQLYELMRGKDVYLLGIKLNEHARWGVDPQDQEQWGEFSLLPDSKVAAEWRGFHRSLISGCLRLRRNPGADEPADHDVFYDYELVPPPAILGEVKNGKFDRYHFTYWNQSHRAWEDTRIQNLDWGSRTFDPKKLIEEATPPPPRYPGLIPADYMRQLVLPLALLLFAMMFGLRNLIAAFQPRKEQRPEL